MFIENYERKLKGNSLILTECEEIEVINEFEERMITENDIRGFLPCRQIYEDGRKQFSYDITSKQSLAHLFEERELKEKDVKKIIKGLIGVRSVLEEYLLAEENLILNPKYIYVDPETRIASFVFYPYYGMSVHSSLLGLGTFLLERTDHTDDNAVKLVYGFYKKVANEDYAFEKLLEELKEESINLQSKETPDTENDIDLIEDKNSENTRFERDYVPDDDLQQKYVNIERMTLAVSTCTLVLLIVFVLMWRYTNIISSLGISRNILISICGIIGTLSIATPAAMLISRSRQEKKLLYFKNIEMEITKKRDLIRKRESENVKQWGRTGKINTAEDTVRRLVGYKDDKVIEYSLKQLPYVLGKDRKEVDGLLDNEAASRIHAKITLKRGEYYITDLNSTNGTSVNGRMLSANESAKIKENDEISFAGEVFYFR